ncbi:MAG: glycosyltransferase family 9 protein [Verrucomicrobiota bacterium]
MLFESSTLPEGPARVWVRLPNWLGDVVMAVPLVRAMRASLPGAEFTLLAQSHFVPLLEQLGLAENLMAVPSKGGLRYFSFFFGLRKQAPDVHVLFTNSTRGDLEARVVGAPLRCGIARPGKPRRFLTETWSKPDDLDEAEIHQTRLWERFLQHFGLEEPLDLSPISTFRSDVVEKRIGLICATENSPEKRWPIERWRELIDAMPGFEFHLFGTPRDAEITGAVAERFSSERVVDRAGKTGLVEFARELTQCETLLANDTGGMHIANLLGVPTVALFGPTNPIRTGPVFEGPTRVLQPEGCPPSGGTDMKALSVPEVIAACEQFSS